MKAIAAPSSLGLLTDLYQLTMSYGYWKNQRHQDDSVFHLFFRKAPFGNQFALAAGLEAAADFIETQFRFSADDCAYLESLTGNDDRPLFEADFLDDLRDLKFSGDIYAVPEGTAVFGNEPMLRVRAPILEAQLLETPLLNLINFPTLIATKAARIVAAAEGDPVIEFGLRRAQGIDGGLTATRAAYLGGCVGTSNVLAGKRFGIPVKGTHAHSWVMSFDSEPVAFDAYARAMPNNCIFLVDTWDTIEGVKHAIEVGRRLRDNGHEMLGVRLDSGNLAKLSIAARRLLDEAGFPDAAIVASNDLDENVIRSLKQQGAAIGVWGVGTKLVTAYDQPALGGVFKLAAIREHDSKEWRYRIKKSDSPGKTSNPGVQQIRRSTNGDGHPTGDTIYCESLGLTEDRPGTDLLQPIFHNGRRCWQAPPLAQARDFALEQWRLFTEPLIDPRHFPVQLDPRLDAVKTSLLESPGSETS